MPKIQYPTTFEYGTGTIVHTEALSLLQGLPSNSIAAVIQDPPFFINTARPTGPTGGKGNDPWVGDDVVTIDDMIKWYAPVAVQCTRALKPGGACVTMGGSQSIAAWEIAACRAGLSWMADLTILWNTGKPRARNFGSLSLNVRWHSKPGFRHSFNSEKRSIYSNVLVCNKVPVQDRWHPAQKPCELTNFIVTLLTNYGDTVVDPFMGSGSTLVSAAMCGRNFIGGDSDPQYIPVARKRTHQVELEESELKPMYMWVNGDYYPVEA